MIFKSYEIEKNPSNLKKYNLFLLYGENTGLKKDIQNLIKTVVNKKEIKTEVLSIYENDVISDTENFYNSIFSGSLFSQTKILTINSCTDKIIEQIEYIASKCPENLYLIIFSEILEKKSKLRNFFEKDTKTLCVACYPDTNKDLEIIAKRELKKNNINLSQEAINLLINNSNDNRDNLKNEINKIESFALNKKDLKINEIRHLTNFSGEYKFDSFINECLCGNILQYKKILSELYVNTVNQTFLFRILSNKIQKLVNMKKQQTNYTNLDSLVNASKPPIFWKEKPIIKRQLTIWNLVDLNSVIYEINEIEFWCRKKPQISKIIFFNFFNKLCKQANSFS